MRFEIFNEDGIWRWQLVDAETERTIARGVTEHLYQHAAIDEAKAVKAAVPGAWIDA